jgi:hypothetical protein
MPSEVVIFAGFSYPPYTVSRLFPCYVPRKLGLNGLHKSTSGKFDGFQHRCPLDFCFLSEDDRPCLKVEASRICHTIKY